MVEGASCRGGQAASSAKSWFKRWSSSRCVACREGHGTDELGLELTHAFLRGTIAEPSDEVCRTLPSRHLLSSILMLMLPSTRRQ